MKKSESGTRDKPEWKGKGKEIAVPEVNPSGKVKKMKAVPEINPSEKVKKVSAVPEINPSGK